MLENIVGYYKNTGEQVYSLEHSDYVQIDLAGNHAKSASARTLVSKESLQILLDYKWYLSKDGYPTTYQSVDGKQKFGRGIKMHQLLFPYIPKGHVVDHINRDRLDNRLTNLRVCSAKENSYNRSRISGKYKGVRKTGKNSWSVEITKDGQRHTIPGFKSAKDAAKGYDMAAEELFGQYAGKNFD